MQQITEWIETNWHISEGLQIKIFLSVLILVALWSFKFFSLKLVFKRIENAKERYNWRRSIKNTHNILLLLLLGALWVEKFESLATFFGLLSAGLAIALQDPIVNFAGWLFLVLKKPFEVGDRIELGKFAGDVIDIRFFQFTINEINNWVDADQSTGRIIHIPNGKLFKEAQANYTQGFSHIWNEISVLITFESDWQKTKGILESIVKEHAEHLSKAAEKRLIEASKTFLIFYKNLTPVVYTTVKDSGVQLTMRYLCNPKKRRVTEHKIWEDVLQQFALHEDVSFAYPTQRIMYNRDE